MLPPLYILIIFLVDTHPLDFILAGGLFLIQSVYITFTLKAFAEFNALIKEIEEDLDNIAKGKNHQPQLSVKLKPKDPYYSFAKNIENARLEIQKNKEYRYRVLAGFTHDMKTPVAIIQGWSEAISDNMLTKPDEIKKATKIIMQQTEKLTSLADDFTNLINMNSIAWKKNLKPLDLKFFLTDICEKIKYNISIYTQSISSNIELPDETYIMCDEFLLGRIMMNLIQNAFRYTGENGQIRIESRMTKESILIDVIDNGIGLSEEAQNRIWDFLYTGSKSGNGPGNGVGLYISKDMANNLGWDLSVKSKYGEGSTFTVTIPISQRTAKPQQ